MKKNIFKTLLIAISAIISLSLVSCGADEPDGPGNNAMTEAQIEQLLNNGGVKIVNSSFLYEGIMFTDKYHVVLKPHLFVSQQLEQKGLSVNKVVYYINGQEIGSSSSSPYEISYSTSSWTIGEYILSATVTVNGRQYRLAETVPLKIEKASTNFVCDMVFECVPSTKGSDMALTAYLNKERSSEGVKIEAMSVFWDGKLITTITEPPFVVTRTTVEDIGTTHSILAYVTVMDSNGNTSTQEYINTNYTIKDKNTTVVSYMLNSSIRDYKNGETIQGWGRFWDFREIKSGSEKLEVFLDNNLIATTTSFPFNHDYKLQNLSVGKHIISTQWSALDSNGNVLVSMPGNEIEINITE